MNLRSSKNLESQNSQRWNSTYLILQSRRGFLSRRLEHAGGNFVRNLQRICCEARFAGPKTYWCRKCDKYQVCRGLPASQTGFRWQQKSLKQTLLPIVFHQILSGHLLLYNFALDCIAPRKTSFISARQVLANVRIQDFF